jgi:hypothetical protein
MDIVAKILELVKKNKKNGLGWGDGRGVGVVK